MERLCKPSGLINTNEKSFTADSNHVVSKNIKYLKLTHGDIQVKSLCLRECLSSELFQGVEWRQLTILAMCVWRAQTSHIVYCDG